LPFSRNLLVVSGFYTQSDEVSHIMLAEFGSVLICRTEFIQFAAE